MYDIQVRPRLVPFQRSWYWLLTLASKVSRNGATARAPAGVRRAKYKSPALFHRIAQPHPTHCT